MYVPSYLNEFDGIFDLNYFDFLIGFDASVFPSYYEPWGYTPMESLAFGIPTITTSLAGFGQWIKNDVGTKPGLLSVIERTDTNTDEVTAKIVASLLSGLELSEEAYNQLRKKAYDISRTTLWDHFLKYYKELYAKALSRSLDRLPLYSQKIPFSRTNPISLDWGGSPIWKKYLSNLFILMPYKIWCE